MGVESSRGNVILEEYLPSPSSSQRSRHRRLLESIRIKCHRIKEKMHRHNSRQSNHTIQLQDIELPLPSPVSVDFGVRPSQYIDETQYDDRTWITTLDSFRPPAPLDYNMVG